MNREELEFRISQYLDGTLPAQESAALDELFATDPEARALHAEYEQLNASLKRSSPLPQIDFDSLATQISAAVAREEIPHRRMFIGNWRMPAALAAAASILIAIGIGVKLYNPQKPEAPKTVAQAPVVEVSGPRAEVAASTPVVTIDIKPAQALVNNNWHVSEDIIYRPSRVTWLGLATDGDNSQDNNDSY